MPEYQFQIHLDSRFRRYSAERCINMIMFIEVTQLRVKLEVFGRASPAQTPPNSYELSKS
jgi:hypothetical protein